jgi:hypothetical protein
MAMTAVVSVKAGLVAAVLANHARGHRQRLREGAGSVAGVGLESGTDTARGAGFWGDGARLNRAVAQPMVQFPQRGPVGVPLHGLRRVVQGEPAVLGVLVGQRQLGVVDAGAERVLRDHQDVRAQVNSPVT